MKVYVGTLLCLLLCSAVPAFAAIPSLDHSFAQIGAGGGIRSVLLVFNPNALAVKVTLELFGDDGSPLSLEFDGVESAKFERQIAANGTGRIVISSASALPTAGWARLVSERPVGAQVLFEIVAADKLVTQAAVEALPPVSRADLFADRSAGSNTGVAICNPSDSSTVVVRLKLKDEAGQILGSTDIVLPPKGHAAKFVSQLFPQVKSFKGGLNVVSTGDVSLIALQQTGLVLGTVSPIVSWH